MKVVHITRTFYPHVGGVEDFVLNLAKQQIKQGMDVEVVTLNRNPQVSGKFAAEDSVAGIKVHRVPFFGSFKYPIAFGVLKYIGDADLVHVHAIDFFADCLAIFRSVLSIRYVVHTHGGIFHSSRGLFFKKAWFKSVTRFSLKQADAVIGCGINDILLFHPIVPNIRQINNGVDVERFLAINCSRQEGEQLVFVGRMQDNKRVDLLLQALAVVVRKRPSVTLKLIGPDHNLNIAKLTKYAAQLGLQDHVHFLGKVSDDVLNNELAQSRLFVSASEYEGFGISVIEAMAAGLVCVLNDIPSFRNFVEESGCGEIVDYSNAERSAAAILKWLNQDDLDGVVQAGRRYAEKMGWERASAEILEVYESVLD